MFQVQTGKEEVIWPKDTYRTALWTLKWVSNFLVFKPDLEYFNHVKFVPIIFPLLTFIHIYLCMCVVCLWVCPYVLVPLKSSERLSMSILIFHPLRNRPLFDYCVSKSSWILGVWGLRILSPLSLSPWEHLITDVWTALFWLYRVSAQL